MPRSSKVTVLFKYQATNHSTLILLMPAPKSLSMPSVELYDILVMILNSFEIPSCGKYRAIRAV